MSVPPAISTGMVTGRATTGIVRCIRLAHVVIVGLASNSNDTLPPSGPSLRVAGSGCRCVPVQGDKMPRRFRTLGRLTPTLVAVILAAGPLVWAMTAAASDQDPTAPALTGEPIAPIPPPAGLDPAKVRLGERLFTDPRLSRRGETSCATCHAPDAGGAGLVPLVVSPESGRLLAFNTPTIFNVALNSRLNWRGQFRTLDEQNEFILLAPDLMNMTWADLLARLRADANYRAAFNAAYGGPIDRAQVLDALAAYERSMLTPGGRFDRYLTGDKTAITPLEEEGYRLFKGLGCVACHQGMNAGGNLFQKFGVFEPAFADGAANRPADLGRFELTGRERDRHVFRVPSLRNVALTAPYFHDGGTPTLEAAVVAMARKQLGRDLGEPEVTRIVAFLDTLTGIPPTPAPSRPNQEPAR